MTSRTRTLAQHLASAIEARANCEKSGNQEWLIRHGDNIETLARNFLPSGSGVDCGTKVDFTRSTGDKLVFLTSFHHMNDVGMYDGWTEHTVTVKPAFQGFNISISGRDRNQIKDYLVETFDCALCTSIVHDESGFHRAPHNLDFVNNRGE